jgi:ABC-type branched-subunit amino acid transport system substrate-binding protein
MLTAACGSRLSDEDRLEAIAAQRGGGGGSNTDGSSSGDGGEASATDGSTATDGGTTSGGTTTGGTTTGGTTGGTGGGGDSCTPGTATGPGVTPTEIKVGNVSQITGLVPGFGKTGVNGVKAYFNMINNQGGVCGRKLTLVTADDRFQAASNRSETEKLASQVIAFVGSVTVVDDGGAPILEERKVADVSLATTQPRYASPYNFSPNPIDPTPGAGAGFANVLRYFKEKEGITTPAIFYQNVATGVNQSNNYKIDFQKAGIPVAAENIYAVEPTATNFRAQATAMKQRGVDLVITVAEVNAMANLARAFADVQYFPKVPFYGAQAYGQKFIQLAGAAAEGTEIGLIFAIPEEKASNPAVAAFDTWYKRTAPNDDPDFFALLSWVGADMFVSALRAAGPDPTQAKIVAALQTYTDYKAGGMVGGINPAQKKVSGCFHIVEVKGGKWQKQFPESGFQCG